MCFCLTVSPCRQWPVSTLRCAWNTLPHSCALVLVTVCVRSLSSIRLLAASWTVARQALLSMEFSRQEYWSGLLFPLPGESSGPRDRTQGSCVSWIGKRSLHHYCLYCRLSESESEVSQSCPTLCNPMDCGLPGSSVHGISQARVLEWIAISFSRGSSWPRGRTRVSRIIDRCFTIWATVCLLDSVCSLSDFVSLTYSP